MSLQPPDGCQRQVHAAAEAQSKDKRGRSIRSDSDSRAEERRTARRHKEAEREHGPCEREEGLLDTLVDLRGGLHELDAELVGELAALLLGDGALLAPVGLVADEDLVHALGRVLLDVRVPCADVWEPEYEKRGMERQVRVEAKVSRALGR